jgi:hypothetical protein
MPIEGRFSSSTSLQGIYTEVVPDKTYDKAQGVLSDIAPGNGITSTGCVS